ncbi:MAG: trypsin-like serine protease [Myxococcales bacterium]|nr:MAG: trypsin-like serine protease [Myxococcales bacterium]
MTRPFIAIAAVALTTACSARAPEQTEGWQQAVVGGEPSDESQDGVLLLRGTVDDGSELLCTASLVAPNLVLTARHCVAYLSEGLFSCSARGELEPSDAEGGRLGLHIPADQLEVYSGRAPRRASVARGQRVFSTLSPTICTNDIAFVLLDRALSFPLVPMRLERPAEAGESSVLVGFGMDESEMGIDYVTQPRRQRRDLRIAAVGPSSVSEGVTTAPPRSLLLRGPSGCIGDSGGPLLSQASGAVLAVYSLQAGESCSAANVGQQLVQVQPFTALISEAFQAAGAEPLPEPEPSASGGDGGQPPASPEPREAGAGGAPTELPTGASPQESTGCSFATTFGPKTSAWLWVAMAMLRRARRRGGSSTPPV